VEVVASLSQGRTAAAQCGLFTHKSVPVIFEPSCTKIRTREPADRGMKLIPPSNTKVQKAWSHTSMPVYISRRDS